MSETHFQHETHNTADHTTPSVTAPQTFKYTEFHTMFKLTIFKLKLRATCLALLTLAVLWMTTSFSATISAQTISATISGFVSDQTDALIRGAQITLTNQASKDKRQAKSNSSGYFSFTAVPAGTYQVEVQSVGFSSFVERNIELHPSDDRTLTNVKLKIGTVETVVTVNSDPSVILSQGEKSVLITAEAIARLPVQGRDVTELIKTLPGFAMTAQGGGSDNLGPNIDTVGGQTQSYTANGVSSQGVQIISDGVNITDPGNGAGSDQVINMDAVQEVKIQTSNFGADSAKGPIVINAVGKSGGSDYHGGLYVYGRTYQLNTQDWFSKHDNDAKPLDRYIYPGFNFGGPVRIPGTDFNHNKKWTFFVNAEDYVQRNVYSYGNAASATVNALVPTANMRNGNFTAGELSNYFGVADNSTSCSTAAGAQLALYINICNPPSGTTPGGAPISGGGNIPTNQFDPGTMAIMNHLIPLPNTATYFSNPSGTATGTQLSAFNYRHVNLQNADSYQARIRSDYAFSDNTKIYFTYSFQHSGGKNPQQIFYSPQQPFGEVNTPGGILNQDYSHVGSVNLTTVISASMTNELFAGASLNYGSNSPGTPGANLSSSIGYPYQGIYAGNQYPQLYDYGFDGLPLALFPDYSSPIFQHKFAPNGGDNLTKVIKTHTLKAGVYMERTTNNQTDLDVASNGQIQQYYLGPNSGPGNIYEPNNTSYPTPGNYLASFFLGEIQQFNQFNFQTNSDLYYWTVDTFVTDSWKVRKNLTLDYGVRIGHVGPWQDAHGIGLAVWDPKLYAAQIGNTAKYVNPGYTWHAANPDVPNSGAGSTFAFVSPRFGIAFDPYGTGKTFFRGGFGAYRSHDGWNDVNQTQATSQGQTKASVGGGGLLLKDVASLAAGGYLGVSGGNSSQAGTNGVGFGLSKGDTEQPLTYTYSFTVSQQLNPSTLLELSYQGSQSSHLLTQYEQGASGDLENINALPIGALFKPDPLNGEVNSPQGFSSENRVNDFRPFPFYSQVNVARHILYSNYNGLQASITRTQGRFLYSINYTWSKNLGVLGSYSTGNVIDSANIRPNYGPLQNDRSQVTNDTFSYQTRDWFHGERLLRGAVNGWEVSGIVSLQSGANMQRVLGSNLNLGGNIQPSCLGGGTACQNGSNTFNVNNLTFLGTPDVVLQPTITCDPGSGLNRKSHQYLNGNCFALPQFGVNGPAELPYIHAPAYFDLDARLSKSFKLAEKRDFEIQLSAFNVINRPNYSFSSKFPTEQTLHFIGQTMGTAAPPSDFGMAQFRFGRRVTEISLKYNF
jgi:Carboxypeptidase regulatory-like domain/TonB-dependent Receptor Plug Domain